MRRGPQTVGGDAQAVLSKTRFARPVMTSKVRKTVVKPTQNGRKFYKTVCKRRTLADHFAAFAANLSGTTTVFRTFGVNLLDKTRFWQHCVHDRQNHHNGTVREPFFVGFTTVFELSAERMDCEPLQCV